MSLLHVECVPLRPVVRPCPIDRGTTGNSLSLLLVLARACRLACCLLTLLASLAAATRFARLLACCSLACCSFISLISLICCSLIMPSLRSRTSPANHSPCSLRLLASLAHLLASLAHLLRSLSIACKGSYKGRMSDRLLNSMPSCRTCRAPHATCVVVNPIQAHPLQLRARAWG